MRLYSLPTPELVGPTQKGWLFCTCSKGKGWNCFSELNELVGEWVTGMHLKLKGDNILCENMVHRRGVSSSI